MQRSQIKEAPKKYEKIISLTVFPLHSFSFSQTTINLSPKQLGVNYMNRVSSFSFYPTSKKIKLMIEYGYVLNI